MYGQGVGTERGWAQRGVGGEREEGRERRGEGEERGRWMDGWRKVGGVDGNVSSCVRF